MEKEIIEIDWDLLADISYKSSLGKSLKNTLRKFDKEDLFVEIQQVIEYFMITDLDNKLPYQHRVKALHSCLLKYEKFFPSKPVEQAFNDLLGIRIVIDDYSLFDEIDLPQNVKFADMRDGKATDDGYRGIHLYFQKSHFHYPIELQFVTKKDKQFNEWLHNNTYKYITDATVGYKLRKMYECGEIASEDEFRKELEKCVI